LERYDLVDVAGVDVEFGAFLEKCHPMLRRDSVCLSIDAGEVERAY
jgi:hypothetical protein